MHKQQGIQFELIKHGKILSYPVMAPCFDLRRMRRQGSVDRCGYLSRIVHDLNRPLHCCLYYQPAGRGNEWLIAAFKCQSKRSSFIQC